MKSNQPTTLDVLAENSFRLVFNKFPLVTYFCTATNLPGVQISNNEVNTPLTAMNIPNNTMYFSPLEVEFMVDANLENWLELWKWMVGIGFPTTHRQALAFPQYRDQFSEAILTITTPKKNPFLSLTFHDIWPAKLSDIQFDSQVSGDVQYIKSKCTFYYTTYDYESQC